MRGIDDALAGGPLRQFSAGDLPACDLVERRRQVEAGCPLRFERQFAHVLVAMRFDERTRFVVQQWFIPRFTADFVLRFSLRLLTGLSVRFFAHRPYRLSYVWLCLIPPGRHAPSHPIRPVDNKWTNVDECG